MLTEETIQTIKSTVPLLEEHGRAITDKFYEDLFTQHSFLKNIFNMANQGKGEQSRALADAVVAYAKNIENIEILVPTVQRVAHKHISLGIQKKHYDLVGVSLLGAIQTVLNLPAEHPALLAWAEAYGVLANIFIDAESQLYKENKEQEGGWEGFRDFYIDKIDYETLDVKSFYFKPIDLEQTPRFKGGQYVGIKVRPNDSENYQIRQYSLSHSDEFRISVKAEQGGVVSNYLHSCREGDSVSLQAPSGVFTLSQKKKKKQIFLAGGVGITPLMSMMREALTTGTIGKNIMFIQCARDTEHQIFKSEVSELKAQYNFAHKLCFENSNKGDHQGYLSVDIINQWLLDVDFDPQNSQVYFCGPKVFMAVLNQFFLSLGYAAEDIHYEVFGPTTNL